MWDATTGSSLKKWGSRNRVYAVGDDDNAGYDDYPSDDDQDNDEHDVHDDNPPLYDSLAVL